MRGSYIHGLAPGDVGLFVLGGFTGRRFKMQVEGSSGEKEFQHQTLLEAEPRAPEVKGSSFAWG